MPRLEYLFTDKLNFLDQNKVLQEDQIVQTSNPAVVSIEAVSTDDPLNIAVHSGTGFNISPTGTIVTNQHVVNNASTITITFGDGTKYYVNQYQTVPGIDIAIIKIKGNDLPTIALDMQDPVKSGDIVTVIGNPLGFEKIAERGEVGGYLKIADSPSQVFDIKLQVNPGSSGSPVINDQAQVVGIVFASTTADTNGQSEPRALAIPVQELPLAQL
jgi:S1-C subfamily serine protease